MAPYYLLSQLLRSLLSVQDKHRRRDKEKHSRRERRSHSVQDDEPHEGASKDDEAEELRALALQRLAGSGAEGGGNDE